MGMFDFDKEIERRGTASTKWDSPFVKEDVKPMWVADMDFEAAPGIQEELVNVVKQNVYGYKLLSERYYESVVKWMRDRHQYEVQKDWICYVPNVVLGLVFAVQTVSEPGDEILIPTPVYGPFFMAVNHTDRVVKESKMKNCKGYYTIDFEDLEAQITKKTKAIMLCNPHNPSGRVWTREELKQLADLCEKHDLYVISDDIHCELTTKGHAHTFITQVSENIAEKTIVCTSPSKAFNLASVHVANCIIQNEALRTKFQEIAEQSKAAHCNAFAEAALIGAYEKSGQWLDELNVYLEENMDYFVSYIQKYIPKLTVYKPEGTYLVWVDCRNTGIREEEIHDYLLEKCKVAVNEGTFFGEDGSGFVRFNLACPRATITPVLEKMKEIFC